MKRISFISLIFIPFVLCGMETKTTQNIKLDFKVRRSPMDQTKINPTKELQKSQASLSVPSEKKQHPQRTRLKSLEKQFNAEENINQNQNKS